MHTAPQVPQPQQPNATAPHREALGLVLTPYLAPIASPGQSAVDRDAHEAAIRSADARIRNQIAKDGGSATLLLSDELESARFFAGFDGLARRCVKGDPLEALGAELDSFLDRLIDMAARAAVDREARR